MKNLLHTILKVLNYYEIKEIFNHKKNKKNYLYILKVLSIFLFLNTILIFPTSLFHIKSTIIYTICLNIPFLIILFLRQQIIAKNIEKNNQKLIKYSMIKSDLFELIKNDITTNQKVCLIVTSIFFIYQNLILIPLLILIKNKIEKLFIYNISFFTVIAISIHILGIIYYFKNRKTKQVVKFNRRNSFILKNLTEIVIAFTISIVLTSCLTALLIKEILTVVLIAIITAIPLSIVIKLVIDSFKIKKRITKKINLFDYINKSKKLFDITKSLFSNQEFKVIKLLMPIIFSIVFFIFISIISNIVKLSFNIRLIQTVLFGLFFIDPFLKVFISEKDENALIFTKFIFSLLFIYTFTSLINIKINFTHGFLFAIKDFLLPIISFLNNFGRTSYNFMQSINPFTLILTPVVFTIVYFLVHNIMEFLDFLGKVADSKLRKELTSKNVSIIFGDSLSIYPVIFDTILQIFILFILSVEIAPLAKLFAFLFETFKVAEVFKFNFLKEANILNFFTLLFYIYLSIAIVKLLMHLFSSVSSHFILFNDEIIYYENRIFDKTVLRIPIKKINYLVVKQNIIEKFLDIGSIYIETLNKNNLIKISGVSSIKEKNILIMEKIKGDL